MPDLDLLIFIAATAAFIVYMVLDINGWSASGIGEDVLGLVFGILLIGILYTSRYMSKIRAFKMRLLKNKFE